MSLPIRKTLTLLIMSSLIIAGGCTLQAVRLNQQAQVYQDFGDHQKAEENLLASLDIDYENPASHYWLGKTYEAQGNLEKASYHYGLAVRFAPSMELAQMTLIKTLYRDAQIDQARIYAKRFLEHKGAPARDYEALAKRFDADGMQELAILAYQQGQIAEPFNAQPSIALADYLMVLGQKERSVELLVAAFKIDPYYPGLTFRLGKEGIATNFPSIDPLPPTPAQQRLIDLEL